jgi:hypothetical protein
VSRPSLSKLDRTERDLAKWQKVHDFVESEYKRLGGRRGDRTRAIQVAAGKFYLDAREIERRLALFKPKDAPFAKVGVVIGRATENIEQQLAEFAGSLTAAYAEITDNLEPHELEEFKNVGLPTVLRIARDRAKSKRLPRTTRKVTDRK